MRQKFAIGQDLELLTAAELEAVMLPVRHELRRLKEPPTIQTITFPFTSDGTGNVAGVKVWQVPIGMRADLNRIQMDLPAYPGAVANTTGRLALRRNDAANGNLIYYWPQPGGNVAPSLESYGGDAPRLAGGEALYLIGSALTASTELQLSLQVTLYEAIGTLPERK